MLQLTSVVPWQDHAPLELLSFFYSYQIIFLVFSFSFGKFSSYEFVTELILIKERSTEDLLRYVVGCYRQFSFQVDAS